MNMSIGISAAAAGGGGGGTSATLRRRNSRTVLEAVRQSGSPVRVAEIAKATGLSRPTVETVAEGLLSQGWLRQSEGDAASAPSVGRPARLYSFNETAGYVIGVDVGAHRITVSVGDLLGNVVQTHRSGVTPDLSAESRLQETVLAVQEVIRRARIDLGLVLAVTVGTPGVVSPTMDVIGISPGLPGWPGVNIKEGLKGVVPCDVEIENDANLAAVGERERGVAAGCADMIFLLLGERLGAGIIANDALVRGHNGAAGELGYVSTPGTEDRDPRFGPLESAVNASALVQMGADALPGPSSTAREPLTAVEITRAATTGDPAAVAVVEKLAATLAHGIAPSLLTLNPRMLVIGGGVSLAGEVLRSALSAAIERTVLYPPEILLSALGDDAVVIGAIAQSLGRVEAEVLARVSA